MITVRDNEGNLCRKGVDYIVNENKAVTILNNKIHSIEYTIEPYNPNMVQRRKFK